jgi:hypothetical protein
MQAAQPAKFIVSKGLDAEAEAVDTGREVGIE